MNCIFCNHVKIVLIFYSKAKLKVSQVCNNDLIVNFSFNFNKVTTPVLIEECSLKYFGANIFPLTSVNSTSGFSITQLLLIVVVLKQ